MGFLWRGTRRFDAPKSFRWRGKSYTLRVPNEQSIAWVFKDVIIDDEYGLESLPFTPRTILDVGANIGMLSLWAGANYPDAEIHAYEPNNLLQPYLNENLSSIRASIYSEGVSSRDGFGSFHDQGDSVLGQCKADATGDVVVVSLRTAMLRMGGVVDLLKLDCEGAEWDILQDSAAFESVRSVRMEYHLLKPDQTCEALVGRFMEMGFRASHISRNQGFGMAWFDRL
jgi:FkbM family methyltransferase